MPDYYLLSCADITSCYITTHRARELYTKAQSDPDADLHGDLETGFQFWACDAGLKLVPYQVTPRHAHEVSEGINELLNPPPKQFPS